MTEIWFIPVCTNFKLPFIYSIFDLFHSLQPLCYRMWYTFMLEHSSVSQQEEGNTQCGKSLMWSFFCGVFPPFFSCYIRSKNPEELHDNQIIPWLTHSVIIIIECEHPGGSSEICKANYLSFADYSLIKKAAFTISD